MGRTGVVTEQCNSVMDEKGMSAGTPQGVYTCSHVDYALDKLAWESQLCMYGVRSIVSEF